MQPLALLYNFNVHQIRNGTSKILPCSDHLAKFMNLETTSTEATNVFAETFPQVPQTKLEARICVLYATFEAILRRIINFTWSPKSFTFGIPALKPKIKLHFLEATVDSDH